VLEAHKGQPTLEKRFQQLKSVHELAPVLLKNEARIEAFFLVYFLTLLLQALIERCCVAFPRAGLVATKLARKPPVEEVFRRSVPALPLWIPERNGGTRRGFAPHPRVF
jgi:hypothetical protein